MQTSWMLIFTFELFVEILSPILVLCNWIFHWSWHTWVQLNTDLFKVTHGFIYKKVLAGYHID